MRSEVNVDSAITREIKNSKQIVKENLKLAGIGIHNQDFMDFVNISLRKNAKSKIIQTRPYPDSRTKAFSSWQ